MQSVWYEHMQTNVVIGLPSRSGCKQHLHSGSSSVDTLVCTEGGASVVCSADGASVVCSADGAAVVCSADGAAVVCSADGASVVCSADRALGVARREFFLRSAASRFRAIFLAVSVVSPPGWAGNCCCGAEGSGA